MPSQRLIREFLDQKHLAFVGVSRDPKQFANAVYRKLRDGGRTMYPVNLNPDAETIEGDRCYRGLAEVPDPVDGVVVMVPAAAAVAVVRDAADRGVARVWLHRGAGPSSVSEEAVALCRERGIDVVDGACPLMFEPPAGGVHRLHRWFVRGRFAA